MFIDWDLLVKDRETGKCAWLVSGIEEAKCLWSIVLVRDIQPHIGQIVFKSPICRSHAQLLMENFSLHGFKKIFTIKDGMIRWYKVPMPPQQMVLPFHAPSART